MRTINSQYLGATHVFIPNGQGTFTKFSAFIATVANEGKIRLEQQRGDLKSFFCRKRILKMSLSFGLMQSQRWIGNNGPR